MSRKFLLLLALLAVPAAAQDSAPFLWTLKPEAGSKWTSRSFQRARSTEIYQFGKTQTKVEMTVIVKIVTDWEVLSRDAEGNLTIGVTYRNLTGDGSAKFDGKPGSSPDRKKIEAFTAALVKDLNRVTLTIELSPSAEIRSVKGADAFLKTLKAHTKTLDSNQAWFMERIFKSLYSNETLQGIFAPGGALPTTPLETGKNYPFLYQTPKTLPYPPEISGTRSLTKREGGVATIATAGIVRISRLPQEYPPGVSDKSTTTIRGNAKGNTIINEANGVAWDFILSIRFDGETESVNEALPGPMKVPVWALLDIHTVTEPARKLAPPP